MPEILVPLHAGQMALLTDNHRYKVAVMGRRWGKSRSVTYNLILKALGFKGKVDPVSPEMVLGALPTAVQARKILWKPLLSLATTTFKDHFEYINRSQMLLVPKYGKPSIQIVGANDSNGDGLRGQRIYYFSGDEYQDFNASVLDDVIMPAMADTPYSTLMLTGTPKGKLNILYHAFMREQEDKAWKSFTQTTADNPHISRSEIERMQKTMPPRTYQQEMCASFVEFQGRVYTELTEENLLQNGNAIEYSHYIAGCDFGDINPAVVIFGVHKNVEGEESYVLVNGWYNQTEKPILFEDFMQVVRALNERYHPKVFLCDPSRPSQILQMRADVPAISGYNPIAEGISQVHSLIYQKRLVVSTTVTPMPGFKSYAGKEAYSELLSYRYATARDGTVTQVIAPGQKDHMTDAIRYAIARKKPTL